MTERHPRRGIADRARARRRSARAVPEALEGRQLLAYSPLGFSIPDLAVVDAFAGPVAAYGGPLAVTVDVSNLGQSSIPEPLNQFPGSTSSADAGETEVAVYLTSRVHSPFGERVLLGTIDVPAIPQNRLARVTGTVTLPDAPPPGFPATGEDVFITVEVDPDRQVRDYDRTNNILRPATPVLLVPELPDLQAIALGLPASLNPGDTVVPEVKVANYGAVANPAGTPVVVQVVASLDQDFGPGDVILGTFTIDQILPLAQAPTKQFVPGDANLTDPPNVVTLSANQAVTLPSTGAPYFVGVVVDPLNVIPEISELGVGPGTGLELSRLVDDTGLGLPPAGTIPGVTPTNQPFPFPPLQASPSTPTTPSDPGQPILNTRAAARGSLADRQAARARDRVAPAAFRARPAGVLAARLSARRAIRGS